MEDRSTGMSWIAVLFDKDGPGPKEKLSAYYFGIVKAGK